MAAIEHHHDRSTGEKRSQADQAPGFIGQQKGRHRLARPRRIRSSTVLGQAPDEVVDGVGVGRDEIPNRLRIRVEPLVERSIKIAALHEGLAKCSEG